MASVGVYLRELRARRGVSLDEVARTTRVAERYLAALEADALDSLPAPVFARGFIRAYCQALGEPPEEALACYDSRDGRLPEAPRRPATLPRSGGPEPRSRGALLVSFLLLVVLGMALFTMTLVIQPRDRAERVIAELRPASPPLPSPIPDSMAPAPGASQPVGIPAPPSPPTPVTPADSARPPALPPAAPVPGSATPPTAPVTAPRPAPDAGPTPATAPSLEAVAGGVTSPYRLVARTNETTWIRVRTDDGRSSEENVPAGEVREWVSDRPFVLTVGNAGGVSLELNGRALPPLGAPGAVIPRLVIPPANR
jgi:cytoskeleton protein RodZ